MIDLQPENLEIVRAVLKAHVPQYDVWAFGSRVSRRQQLDVGALLTYAPIAPTPLRSDGQGPRRAHPFSDLDLAIIADRPLDFALLGDICYAFSESDLPIKVDLLDWSCVAESFREIIRNQYEIIQHAIPAIPGTPY